jgi:hypothetical protein
VHDRHPPRAARASSLPLRSFSPPRSREIAISGLTSFKFTTGGTSAGLVGETVSGNYFGLLHVGTREGRVLSPSDDVAGAARAVVISTRLRARYFADRDPVGTTVTLNRHAFTVIGVAPADFSGTFIGAPVDVWIVAESAEPFFGREWRTCRRSR